MFEYNTSTEKLFRLVDPGRRDGDRILFFLKEDVKEWLADKECSTKLIEISPFLSKFVLLKRKVEIIVSCDENCYTEFLLAWT